MSNTLAISSGLAEITLFNSQCNACMRIHTREMIMMFFQISEQLSLAECRNHNFKHVVLPFHKFCTAIGGKNELFQFVMALGKELISCLISVCITISWVCCSFAVAASKLGYKLFLMQWWGDWTVVWGPFAGRNESSKTVLQSRYELWWCWEVGYQVCWVLNTAMSVVILYLNIKLTENVRNLHEKWIPGFPTLN